MQWVNQALLPDLLKFVSTNPHAGFYREKYAKAGVPADIEHFFSLPMLTRAELTDTPVGARVFVPKEEVELVAFTSGTSSKVPLIVPYSHVARYYFEPSFGMPLKRPLIILPPLMKSFSYPFMRMCQEAVQPVSPIFGDVQNLANSALLADAFECDSMYALPTLASLFAPLAQERGIAKNIRLLMLSSETTTTARREELCTLYPNALIANMYASTELGHPVFVPCPTMIERGLNQFHIIPEALAAVELVEGELVISYSLNPATPLVRYRTGDYFEEVSQGCDCGREGPVLAWSHRGEIDRLRINGVEFDLEEADRAFSKLPYLPSARYQVHFRPGEGAEVAISVEIADPTVSSDTMFAQALAQRVEADLPDVWRISSTATVRTALEKKLFSSFTAQIVPHLSIEGTKAKRFINHVE